MKKYKLLSLSLVFILLLGLLSGCAQKDPKELLKEASLNQLDVKTSKQYFEMSLNIDAALEDPMANTIIQAINNAKLAVEISSDTENKKFSANATLDLSGYGTTFNLEFYGNEDIIIVKVPMYPQYLYFEQTEETKALLNGDKPQEELEKDMEKLVKELIDIMLNSVKDENLIMEKKVSVKTENIDEKLTKIEMKFGNEEFMVLVKDMIKMYFENDIMKDMIKNQMEVQGQITTDEEFDTIMDEMKSGLDEGFSEVENVFKLDKFIQTYYLDNKNLIRSQDFEVGFSIISELDNIDIKIEIAGKSDIWDINEKIDIVIPEIDKEESLNILDLINDQMNMFNY